MKSATSRRSLHGQRKPRPGRSNRGRQEACAPEAFSDWDVPRITGLLVLADGTVIEGQGFGAEGEAVGEVCFNTAMTGYQEILTDPSYAGQIITFTFPHIGNVGTNEDDIETANLAAASGVRGCIVKAAVTDPANYRSHRHFEPVAEGARHRRPVRHRHPRADQSHPRQGHAERRHRP